MHALIAAVSLVAGLSTPDADEVAWVDSLSEAEALAGATDRPILAYFWLEGSAFCDRFYSETLTSEAGAAELANFVCVSLPASSPESRPLVDRYRVSRLPTVVFIDAHGDAQDAISGFISQQGFLDESQRIRRGEKTVNDWRERARVAPDDLDVRLRLALQLEHVGQLEECGRLQASIRSVDPLGLTVAGAQLLLYDVFAEVRQAATDASDPSTYPLGALYAHMPNVKPAPILFEGWRWIADIEQQRGDRAKERAAWTQVAKVVPVGEKGMTAEFTLLRRFFQMESELSDDDRRVALEVSAHFTAEAERFASVMNAAYVHHANALALAVNGQRERAFEEASRAVELEPDAAVHQGLRDVLAPTER